jgi:hypothetical protein
MITLFFWAEMTMTGGHSANRNFHVDTDLWCNVFMSNRLSQVFSDFREYLFIGRPVNN